MKKLMSLLLCLAMMLSVTALASAENLIPVTFDDFTLYLQEGDLYETYEKVEGQMLFQVFPAYSETNAFHNNLNGVWVSQNLASVADQLDPTDLANQVLAQMDQGLAAQGIAYNNGRVLSAEMDAENGVIAVVIAGEADYTGAGVNLKMELCQLQVYCMLGEQGTYIFTITADSIDSIEQLSNYIYSISFN